jgi:hypothetical protein
MIPDIEREWIEEECRSTPSSSVRWILLILLLAAVGFMFREWLA